MLLDIQIGKALLKHASVNLGYCGSRVDAEKSICFLVIQNGSDISRTKLSLAAYIRLLAEEGMGAKRIADSLNEPSLLPFVNGYLKTRFSHSAQAQLSRTDPKDIFSKPSLARRDEVRKLNAPVPRTDPKTLSKDERERYGIKSVPEPR
jgi:hypothetical protein